MKNRELYYNPSGRISLKFLLAMAIGVSVAAVLGVFYSWCIWNITFIYINVILTVLFAVILAGVSGGMIRFGKVRNFPVGLLFAFLIAIVFLYAKWTEWRVIIGDEAAAMPGSKFIATGLFTSFLQPGETWSLMVVSTKLGIWEVAGFEVKGILLWLVWIVEAAIFFYFQFITALRQPRLPFSEVTKEWLNGKLSDKFITATVTFNELCEQLEAGDFSQLTIDHTGKIEYDRKWTIMCYEDNATGEYFLDIAESTGKVKNTNVPLFGGDKSLGFLRISKVKYEMLQEKIGGEWKQIDGRRKKSAPIKTVAS
jgi:hypothetical protein